MKNLNICKKKLWQLRSNFLLLSYESTIYARQFIWYHKKWTMDLKISRTQTPKSQIKPKAVITERSTNNKKYHEHVQHMDNQKASGRTNSN